MQGTYWIGQDGNVWVHGPNGVNSVGAVDSNSESYWNNLGFTKIPDPAVSGVVINSGAADASSPTTTSTNTSTSLTAAEIAEAKRLADEAAERQRLRAEIAARGGEIDATYGSLFGDLDLLLGARDAELTTQYGQQRGKAGSQYAEALPEIDKSYAAISSYDSTQRTDSRGKAKKGFEDTVATIGQNETADKGKLGQYGRESRAKFTADRDTAKRNVGRAGSTEDVGALRGMRNDLETNLSTAGVTRATLGTEGSARQELSNLTKDSGRYDAAINALDAILKSSMGSGTKAAAVEAITSSAGLSDEEKKKVQQTYGNVYAEQAAI